MCVCVCLCEQFRMGSIHSSLNQPTSSHFNLVHFDLFKKKIVEFVFSFNQNHLLESLFSPIYFKNIAMFFVFQFSVNFFPFDANDYDNTTTFIFGLYSQKHNRFWLYLSVLFFFCSIVIDEHKNNNMTIILFFPTKSQSSAINNNWPTKMMIIIIIYSLTLFFLMISMTILILEKKAL